MADSTTPAPVERPAGLRSLAVTPEVQDKFVEGLKLHGTFDAAARHARPHLVARGSKHCSVGTFREHARRNPDFAARCEEALSDFKGEMEALAVERAKTVDTRPHYDKNGNFLGVEENRRNANDMLKVVLARIDPSAWAPKRNVNIDATVTHNDAKLTGGAAYVVKPDDMMLLDEDKRRLLVSLLVEMEEARKAALPEPEPIRPYGTWKDHPAALPAPENANGQS
jgi:hypothetical protein